MIGVWDYHEDDGLDEYYADVESFESHYADEIEGRAEDFDPDRCSLCGTGFDHDHDNRHVPGHIDPMTGEEIEGRAEYPVPPAEETSALRLGNAPGQLRLPLGGGL